MGLSLTVWTANASKARSLPLPEPGHSLSVAAGVAQKIMKQQEGASEQKGRSVAGRGGHILPPQPPPHEPHRGHVMKWGSAMCVGLDLPKER